MKALTHDLRHSLRTTICRNSFMSLSKMAKELMSYPEYYSLVQHMAETGQTTGMELSQERIIATKLNAQRMKRLDKQAVIRPELMKQLSAINGNWTWLVLAESWCGDGAQIIPILAKMAEINPDRIALQIALRDENPDLMETCLTNNVKAIPKLICLSRKNQTTIGTWGPRPAAIQEKVKILKQDPTIPHEEFLNTLHTWYAADKGESVQDDFLKLIKTWNQSKLITA